MGDSRRCRGSHGSADVIANRLLLGLLCLRWTCGDSIMQSALRTQKQGKDRTLRRARHRTMYLISMAKKGLWAKKITHSTSCVAADRLCRCEVCCMTHLYDACEVCCMTHVSKRSVFGMLYDARVQASAKDASREASWRSPPFCFNEGEN